MRKPFIHLLIFLAALAALAALYGHFHPPAPQPAITPRPNAPVQTASGACGQNLWNAAQPALPPKMAQGLTLVCYQGYTAAASPITRTPLWSAEHLTAERIATARETERASAFFAEPSLPFDARADLTDYRRSGYDRGHLSPSGDMPGHQAQHESFSLANIAPQDPDLNRGAWAELEGKVRDVVARHGEAWVVTGVLFEGQRIATTPDGRVMVPTSFWKAVVLPDGHAAVFLAPNASSGTIAALSLDDFRQRTGINPFPALSAQTSLLEIDG